MTDVTKNEILQALNAFSSQMDKNFVQIDKRFEKIDERFDKMDRRFDSMDQRFERVEADITGIKATMVTKEDLALATHGLRSEMVTKTYLDNHIKTLRIATI